MHLASQQLNHLKLDPLVKSTEGCMHSCLFPALTSQIAVTVKSNAKRTWASDELAFGCSFNVVYLSNHQFEA